MEEIKNILHTVLNEVNSLKSQNSAVAKPRRSGFVFGMVFSLILFYGGVFASQHIPDRLVKLVTFSQFVKPDTEEAVVVTPKFEADKNFAEQAALIGVVDSKSDTLAEAVNRIEIKLNNMREPTLKSLASESKTETLQSVASATTGKNKAPVFNTTRRASAPVF